MKKFLKLSLFSAMILAMSIFFNACKGEVGPKGDTGATGATGATGSTGAAGATGSANVVYSNWIPATSWILDSYFSVTGRYFDITAPLLTREILDKGVVRTYWKPAANLDAIISLPTRTGAKQEYYPEYKVGRIRIWLFNDARTDPGSIPSTNEFRYVIIPGSIAGGRQAAVDYSNYSEVKKYYNLPD